MHHAYTGGYSPADLMGGFDVIGQTTRASSPTSESGGSVQEAMIEGEQRDQVFIDTSGEPDGGGGVLDLITDAAKGIVGAATGGILGGGSSGTPGAGGAFPVVTVRDVQKALNVLGFGPLEEDNILGPMSKAAVKRYQTTKGLSPDGNPGPQTKAALQSDVAAKAGRSGGGGLLSNLPSLFGPPSQPGTIPVPFFGPIPNPFAPSPPPAPTPVPRPPSGGVVVKPSAGPFGLSPPMLVGAAVLGLGVLAGAAFLLSGPKKRRAAKRRR